MKTSNEWGSVAELLMVWCGQLMWSSVATLIGDG